jgi:acetate kinase
MVDDLLLTCNSGSSSIKFGVYANRADGVVCVGKAVIDIQSRPLCLKVTAGHKTSRTLLTTDLTDELHEVLREVLDRLFEVFEISNVLGVGHRVVHGGDRFDGPVIVNDDTLAAIKSLVPLAPLHQPQALNLIHAVRRRHPGLPQTASFDTAFHMTNGELVRRLALPRALHHAGLKRYGFHGLSYSYIARELSKAVPELARRKIVVAHLGSGCSLCGLEHGLSRDTSMGFSTLDGVPMATRCGALDPGVILHLLTERRQSPADLIDLLYNQSGLLGVSGISGDTQDLLKNDDPHAQEALDLFAFRIAGEVARIANTLGGLDALVFTAGIGEHQPQIRAAIASHLAWLGVALDPHRNAAGKQVISPPTSRVLTLVMPTDEEQIIAEDAGRLLRRTRENAIP